MSATKNKLNKAPELLACPKCKSLGAQLQQPRKDDARFWVLCGNPDCDMAVSISWWASPEQAVAAWNGHKLRNVNQAHRESSAKAAAERLADRNRRWAKAIEDAMSAGFPRINPERAAAVFDAIASEASCGEIPNLLRR